MRERRRVDKEAAQLWRGLQAFWQAFPNLGCFCPRISKDSFGGFVGFQRVTRVPNPKCPPPNFFASAAARRARRARRSLSDMETRYHGFRFLQRKIAAVRCPPRPSSGEPKCRPKKQRRWFRRAIASPAKTRGRRHSPLRSAAASLAPG